MKVNHVSRSALYVAPIATLVLGFCLQACGGSPDGEPTASAPQEKTGQSAQDLSILGINIPEPTISASLGDAGITIDPVGVVDGLIPEKGITLPDPFQPVDNILTGLGKPITASIGTGDVGVTVKLPPLLPPDLGGFLSGLDPFADGGIQLIGK